MLQQFKRKTKRDCFRCSGDYGDFQIYLPVERYVSLNYVWVPINVFFSFLLVGGYTLKLLHITRRIQIYTKLQCWSDWLEVQHYLCNFKTKTLPVIAFKTQAHYSANYFYQILRVNAISNGQIRGDSYGEGCLGQTGYKRLLSL